VHKAKVSVENRIRIVLFGVVALIAGIVIAEVFDGVKTALLVVAILIAGVAAAAVWGDDRAEAAVKSSLHAAAIAAFLSVSVALYYLIGFLLNMLSTVFAEWGALLRVAMWVVLAVVATASVIAYLYHSGKSRRGKAENSAK